MRGMRPITGLAGNPAVGKQNPNAITRPVRNPPNLVLPVDHIADCLCPVCGETEPPPTGATLLNDAGKPVGDVRSTAISPRLGAIALAIVRREVESGATLAVHWEGGEAQADVSALPFPL